MKRGEIWLAETGGKRRPVLILTRSAVIDVRRLVTVAEITTSIRGLVAEVQVDHVGLDLDHQSAINCDGLHTIPQSMLTEHLATADEHTMERVCAAAAYAIGC